MDFRERALSLLAKFYGYRSFRPGQYEVIEAVASGRDAVVLLPTGGGKSLCFQMWITRDLCFILKIFVNSYVR